MLLVLDDVIYGDTTIINIQGSTCVKWIVIIVVFILCSLALFLTLEHNSILSIDAACSSFAHTLKVLNGKVAEEMDIVENHLTGLTGMHCLCKSASLSRDLQRW